MHRDSTTLQEEEHLRSATLESGGVAMRWYEGVVPRALEHFALTFREDVESIARLGKDRCGRFVVEFLERSPVKAIETAREELDFHLHEVGERDPWAYAKYHCTTASNVVSDI